MFNASLFLYLQEDFLKVKKESFKTVFFYLRLNS